MSNEISLMVLGLVLSLRGYKISPQKGIHKHICVINQVSNLGITQKVSLKQPWLELSSLYTIVLVFPSTRIQEVLHHSLYFLLYPIKFKYFFLSHHYDPKNQAYCIRNNPMFLKKFHKWTKCLSTHSVSIIILSTSI